MRALSFAIFCLCTPLALAAPSESLEGTYQNRDTNDCRKEKACVRSSESIAVKVGESQLCGGIFELNGQSGLEYTHFFAARKRGQSFKGFFVSDVTRRTDSALNSLSDVEALTIKRAGKRIELHTKPLGENSARFSLAHKAYVEASRRPDLSDFATSEYSLEEWCKSILSNPSFQWTPRDEAASRP